MAEGREGATPSCSHLPWRGLLPGCLGLGALWPRAEAALLSRRTTCLCGQTICTLPCGHSWHHRPPPRFPRCPICSRRDVHGVDEPASPVCSTVAAVDERETLVLLPPPPSRFVHARDKDEQPLSPSSVRASGMQDVQSSSPPP